MHIVGVHHNRDHIRETVDFLKKHVSAQQRVALEWPDPLEKLLNPEEKDYIQDFWIAVAKKAQQKGAIPFTADDSVRNVTHLRIYIDECANRNRPSYNFERMCLIRTLANYREAEKHQADFHLTGSNHAYHLQLLGMPQVTLLASYDRDRQYVNWYLHNYRREANSIARDYGFPPFKIQLVPTPAAEFAGYA